jgi:hypothetical protein
MRGPGPQGHRDRPRSGRPGGPRRRPDRAGGEAGSGASAVRQTGDLGVHVRGCRRRHPPNHVGHRREHGRRFVGPVIENCAGSSRCRLAPLLSEGGQGTTPYGPVHSGVRGRHRALACSTRCRRISMSDDNGTDASKCRRFSSRSRPAARARPGRSLEASSQGAEATAERPVPIGPSGSDRSGGRIPSPVGRPSPWPGVRDCGDSCRGRNPLRRGPGALVAGSAPFPSRLQAGLRVERAGQGARIEVDGHPRAGGDRGGRHSDRGRAEGPSQEPGVRPVNRTERRSLPRTSRKRPLSRRGPLTLSCETPTTAQTSRGWSEVRIRRTGHVRVSPGRFVPVTCPGRRRAPRRAARTSSPAASRRR